MTRIDCFVVVVLHLCLVIWIWTVKDSMKYDTVRASPKHYELLNCDCQVLNCKAMAHYFQVKMLQLVELFSRVVTRVGRMSEQ